MQAETERLMLESMGFTSTAVSPESAIKTFSGGEKQGVAIVRALFFDAEIIVLDEPTMGLSQTAQFCAQYQRSRQIGGFY
jgi:simple sugar transport system ATP-binding protein